MSEQEFDEADEKSPFSFDELGVSKNWMLDIFREAVRSNNYPVIGLFFVGFGSIMKMMNSDFPIVTAQSDILTAGPGGGYSGGLLGDWLRQILGTGRRLSANERLIQINLSDVLVLGGLGLIGSPLIGKLSSFVP